MKNYLPYVFFVLLFSCSTKHHHKVKKLKLTEYKIHHDWKGVVGHEGKTEIDDFIWDYIIEGNNNTYYYYSSPTQVTNFKGINWTLSSKDPLEEEEEEAIEEENDLSLDVAEISIPPEMESEVSQSETENESTDGGEADGSSSSSDAGSSGDGGSSGDDGGGGE